MALYHSPKGLFPFQAEQVAISYLAYLQSGRDTILLNLDTGLGKSHCAMALAALLLEDGLIDNVLLVCEKNKLSDGEWPRELSTYTDIPWQHYAGTPKKRAKIREDPSTILLASYDIVKNDAAVFRRNDSGNVVKPLPGPLAEALAGKRVFLIYDETTRLANRKSTTHKSHNLLVSVLRQTPGFRMLAMTATPMEKDPVSYYNLARIFVPDQAPTVAQFEHFYVTSYDVYQEPSDFANLTAEDRRDTSIPPLNDLLSSVTLRKRQSDPDVVGFFPKVREMPPLVITLGNVQRNFYNAIEALSDDAEDPFVEKQFVTIMRQIAGHPSSLLRSEGEIAKRIVESVTPEGISAIPSAKTERMLSWCQEVVRDQGAQAVIFTWFTSVLFLLEQALLNQGYAVSINHGQMSQTARSYSQQEFRSGRTEIFLTSDAGRRGINLPEATYLLHYERSLTHSDFVQRSNRINRIDSAADLNFIYSMVADHTIEDGLYVKSLKRNGWSDKLLGDDQIENENFISAQDRRELLKIGRQLAK